MGKSSFQVNHYPFRFYAITHSRPQECFLGGEIFLLAIK
jgi:hypothetical protein